MQWALHEGCEHVAQESRVTLHQVRDAVPDSAQRDDPLVPGVPLRQRSGIDVACYKFFASLTMVKRQNIALAVAIAALDDKAEIGSERRVELSSLGIFQND